MLITGKQVSFADSVETGLAHQLHCAACQAVNSRQQTSRIEVKTTKSTAADA